MAHSDNDSNAVTSSVRTKGSRKKNLTFPEDLLGYQLCLRPDYLNTILKDSLQSYDNEQATVERLKVNCANNGLCFRGITQGDGSCFFHAISDQLSMNIFNQTKYSSDELRKMVADWLQSNYILQGPDGDVDLRNYTEKSWERYCMDVKQPTTYADHIVVMVMAQLLQHDILIVTSSPEGGEENCLTWVVGRMNFQGSPMTIGHFWENHYQSLMPLDYMQNPDVFVANVPDPPNEFTSCKSLFDDEVFSIKAEDEIIIKLVPKNKIGKHVNRTFKVLSHTNSEEFMNMVIQMAIKKGAGSFTYMKQKKKKEPKTDRKSSPIPCYYYCERHSVPRSHGKVDDPKKTVANKCNAFLGFVEHTITNLSVTVIEIREQLQHTGHDIGNPSEWKVNPIDQELRHYIEWLITQGKRPHEILALCWKWSKTEGHVDFQDRRYYPAPKDINNAFGRFMSLKREDKSDEVSVEIICTQKMTDRIIFYQGQDEKGEKPLVIVYQNKHQIGKLKENEQHVVFMDASYKGLTAYKYAVYCIHGISPLGGGVPLAFFIISKEDTETLVLCLTKLVENAAKNNITFCPRTFMIDKDQKEKSAIEKVFPNTNIILCWFHVLQAVYRELNKKESGVSGNSHSETRKSIIAYLRRMRYSATKKDFDELAKQLNQVFSQYPQVVEKLQRNWVVDGHLWANWGRKHQHGDQETNNISESFFHSLKYNFLGGRCNRRLDDLLHILDEEVGQYHEYVDKLKQCGRIAPKHNDVTSGAAMAEKLLLQGWLQKCVWEDEVAGLCRVRSVSRHDQYYLVDLCLLTCTCSASSQRGMCKHVHIVKAKAAQNNFDAQNQRKKFAEQIIEQEQYDIDKDTVTVFFRDNLTTVTSGQICTCVANSHNVECICLLVAKKIKEKHSSECHIQEVEVPTVTPSEKSNPDSDDIFSNDKMKKMLNDISAFVESGKFQQYSRKKELFMDIKRAHVKCTQAKFTKVSNKSILSPNSKKDQAIREHFKKKRQKLRSDHLAYTLSNSKKKKLSF